MTLSTPFKSMERSSKKINNVRVALKDTLHQRDLTDIFRKFHPKIAEHSCRSNAHGTLSRIDHILGYKRNIKNKFKKIKVIPCIFLTTMVSNYKSTTRNNLERPQIHGS